MCSESTHIVSTGILPCAQDSPPTRRLFVRILLSALLVATKFYDDCYYSNANYAKMAGIRLHELNSLEAGFLRLISGIFENSVGE